MRMFGLIGYPLTHSFSKKFFAEKFAEQGIRDCSYENFSIPSMEQFSQLIENKSLAGLNVTIPYKQDIIPYLHKSNDVVARIGACNCIKIKNGKLFGYNTDTIGFEQSLKKYLLPHHDKAIILGTGGSSKAIRFVLEKLNIQYLTVSRAKADAATKVISYEALSDELLTSHTLIINTTPVGMYPLVDAAPPINYRLLTSAHYLFDLVYNPETTLFLKKGREMGASTQNGFDMLIIQAEESWKIWNELD